MNRRIGGTIQLLEHQLNGQCYRSTGYFTDGSEEEGYIPYINTDSGIFSKDTRGLKIVIPFVRQEHTEHSGTSLSCS